MAKPRIPEIDLTDDRLLAMAELLEEMATKRCPNPDDFEAFSRASMAAVADVQWLVEQRRLERACTTAEVITVGGEPYRKLSQPSARIYQGLWGAHRIEEPLYRRIGVHNGPTLKPLDVRIGVVEGVVLPNLARVAGALMATMTSRQTEQHLLRLGLRPPSRAFLERHIIGMFGDMAVGARELEDHCRRVETLDFELSAVSCGLDRFAVRMDETLPDGPERDHKLEQRRPADEYERTPPEPYARRWRMAWAGNVTLYDSAGHPRHSFRYGTSASDDATALVARMVDDIEPLARAHDGVTVCCIQDGAPDIDLLRRELDERLPPQVARRDLVDFHHAIAYLDDIVSAKGDGDPHDMAGWYRLKLLLDDQGCAHIIGHLRRELAGHREHRDEENEDDDAEDDVHAHLEAALTYFDKRRSHMAYAQARAANLPVASGATESTCSLFQLRVKHPGSHWGPTGLRGVMTARGLDLSNRWDHAFDAHHAALHEVVLAA